MSRGPRAELRLGLHQHLPGTSEHVEVVHIQSTDEGLQRVVGVSHRNAERLQLFVVHLHAVRRDVRPEGADDICQFGPLARRVHQRVGRLRQGGDIAARTILHHELKTARRAQSENRRQAEGECECFGNRARIVPER